MAVPKAASTTWLIVDRILRRSRQDFPDRNRHPNHQWHRLQCHRGLVKLDTGKNNHVQLFNQDFTLSRN